MYALSKNFDIPKFYFYIFLYNKIRPHYFFFKSQFLLFTSTAHAQGDLYLLQLKLLFLELHLSGSTVWTQSKQCLPTSRLARSNCSISPAEETPTRNNDFVTSQTQSRSISHHLWSQMMPTWVIYSAIHFCHSSSWPVLCFCIIVLGGLSKKTECGCKLPFSLFTLSFSSIGLLPKFSNLVSRVRTFR